jgi:hypothetical protein
MVPADMGDQPLGEDLEELEIPPDSSAPPSPDGRIDDELDDDEIPIPADPPR